MLKIDYNKQEINLPYTYNLNSFCRVVDLIRKNNFWKDYKICVYETGGRKTDNGSNQSPVQDTGTD